MSKDIVENIPKDIKLYLDEIAERLWAGHAAVMVGAGFSKNAKKSSPLNKNFPDWNQLGNIFYKKIYGSKPKEDQHYLNVLKLADEVQAAFGRAVLDQILRSEIPDKEYEPSQLHIKLMELPWTDVFTTNYDTLLERACVDVYSQKYDVVVCKEDLVHSEKPRIIKLHGSFPSERPFIITEEDYRKYPEEFAPFVNTVQQSLLENSLCLIGFSGDDPNFLQWIGWIQDNLGKENSPKIYLIGVLNLSHAQKRLLEQRNIVLVDLSDCDGADGSHEKALNIFVDYLFSVEKAQDNLQWPEKQTYYRMLDEEQSIVEIKAVICEWKSTRKKYPGWIILPEDRRSLLWIYIENNIHLLYEFNKVDSPYDINFLYEFNWRIERCLCPIFNDFISKYEEVLERYNPFSESLSIDAEIVPEDLKYQNLPWDDIKHEYLELHISLLRFYREEGFVEKWNLTNEKLQTLYQFLSPELVSRLHYERCLFALFLLDISETKKQIKEWPVNDSLPFWEAKRAGIIAEIGDVDTASKILKQSLSSIRRQLNLAPVSSNYLLVSQEAYVMQLLQYVNSPIAIRDKNLESQENDIEKFGERWNDLKQYKCDPWNEQKLFEVKLEKLPVNYSYNMKKSEFDIGHVTMSYSFSRTDKEALNAYSFLRYYEEIGMPFRIQNFISGKKASKGALKRISNYSPFWAFAVLIRIGDKKAIDTVFNRESICEMDISQIDTLIYDYLSAIENAVPEIISGNSFRNYNFSISLATVIPEILSRLCLKCSNNAKLKLLDFLKKVYLSKHKHKFEGIYNLMRRLILSLSIEEQYELLPKFLEFPILLDLNEIEEREFPDPFQFISIDSEFIGDFDSVEISNETIEDLIKRISSNGKERKIASLRLGELYELNLLNSEQIEEFSKALWSQIDRDSGFPEDAYSYKFIFLKLPHPSNVDPSSLFKEFVFKERIPIQSLKQDEGIPITNGDIIICDEILGGANKKFLKNNRMKWSEQEALVILKRLIEWWNYDKKYLKDDIPVPFGSISDEFHARFRNLVDILSIVIAPILSVDTTKEVKESILKLFKEFDEFNIPFIRAKASFIHLFDYNISDIYMDIVDEISSKNNPRIFDAINAIFKILDFIKHSANFKNEMNKFIDLICQQIKWRREESLVSSLNAVSLILIDFPEYLNEKHLEDILLGLKYIIIESDPKYMESNTDIPNRLSYRKAAAYLAFRLFLYYSEKEEVIPQVIFDWKKICFDENEFAEIRNQWI